MPPRFALEGRNPRAPVAAPKSTAAQANTIQADTAQAVADLNSGNYAGAWQAALNSSSLYGTNMNSVTKDPLLAQMEGMNGGLAALDPSKTWNAADINSYYNAFNGTAAYHGNNAGGQYLGQDPYGLWGGASGISGDAAANIAQAGGSPDVSRFVGARPSTSFMGKYGTDIGALALAVAAPYAIGAIAPMLAGGAAAGSLGSIAATAGAGAIVGGAGAAGMDVLGNHALTLGSVGKGALLGGVGAGTGAYLNGNGLGNIANGSIGGAVTGGVRGAIDGQGVISGAEGGAIQGASGAVQGSIINAGTNLVSGGGSAYAPGVNPNTSDTGGVPPASLASGNSNMSADPSYFDFLNNPTSTNVSTAGTGQDPITTNFNPTMGFTDPSLGMNAPVGGYLPTDSSGNVITSGGGSSGGSTNLLAQLAHMLTGGNGSSGGGSGLTPSMLTQLLGLASSAGGGQLQSNAAKGAASTFGNETKYAPTTVSGLDGSTTGGVTTLSPGAAATSAGLTGMDSGLIKSLAAGPGATANADFNSLASSQLQAQQRLMANTQDNEKANGVLSSTAGGYQTQGALGAIGSQISGDQVTANNMAATQQQDQLAQLTAGLNGNDQINKAGLAAGALGNSISGTTAGANSSAYSPSLAANSNSNIGNLLASLGNGATNSGNANSNALAQYLASLGGG